MSVFAPTRPISASELATVTDCEARFFHDRQRYTTGLLPTDRIAADVSSALHRAVMDIHRRMEDRLRRGQLPNRDEVRYRLRTQLDQHLFGLRLKKTDPDVVGRLLRIDPGLDRVADLILADAPGWAVDPSNGAFLVWVEGPLNHGPGIPAVEISPGRLVSTRPDLIGFRRIDGGLHRAVVRDYKAKGQIVSPEFDLGILVRALWVLVELKNPRCPWFLAGRGIEIDQNTIDLETINVMFADRDDEFRMRASLSEPDLQEAQARILRTLDRAEGVLTARSPDDVDASPGNFCLRWCPYLNRCDPGMEHVRRYEGQEVLLTRLSEV